MRLVIGFGHKSRVGKDTCTKFLVTLLRMGKVNVQHISFAKKLKEVCHDLYGWAGLKDATHYENYPEDRYRILPAIGKSPLTIWVEVGNAIRGVYSETWVKAALLSATADVVVVSDVRFPNEVDVILEQPGGRVYKVVNDKAPMLDTESDKALDSFEGWTGVFENNGTMNDLYNKIEAFSVEIIKAMKE